MSLLDELYVSRNIPGWTLLQRIFFRYRCPYPITSDHSARACVESGKCGCSNAARFSPKRSSDND